MKKSVKKQLLNISFMLLMAIVTMIIVLKSNEELNYANLRQFFCDCNLGYIVMAFICWIGFVLFEALSLHIILKRLGYKPKKTSSIVYSTSDIYYSGITPSASGGQPASAYYMIKDGISGGASGFSLIFNITGYTAAILVIGIFAFVFGFNTFIKFSLLVKTLVIIGIVAQVILLAFFIACMRCHNIVLKCGCFLVKMFCKIKIIRKEEKWLNRIDNVVKKYKSCYEDFKKHKKMFIPVLMCNVFQRVSQLLISVFVCKAAIDCSFFEIFIMQSFVMVGYNSLPLPGGVGAYEYLYLEIYCLALPKSFVIISMMVTRVISYYISLIISGAYTMVYHIGMNKRKTVNLEEIKVSNV